MEAEQVAIVVATFFFPPLLALVSLVLGLATFGKSLGIRRRYVRFLVQVFEWGARIKRAKERQQSAHSSQAPSDAESEEDCTDSYLPRSRAGSSSQPQLIQREATPQILKALQGGQTVTKEEKVWAIVNDSLDFIKSGMETIIEDEVTSRFSAEELASWNMLSRTSVGIQFLSYRLTFVWVLGFLFRYFILLPVRLLILSVGLTFLVVTTAVVGYFPPGPLKKRLNSAVSLMSYRILCRSISAIISFHHAENQARPGGICVANHTSPIDVIILSNDNCYALVGQKHGGLLGLVQRALSRAASHIWFERSVAADRAAVAARLRAHVRNLNNLPILIFPEGTCINNTSVMQFKKGAFEASDVVYPVAIKYDPRFGDPFWNSGKQSAVEYLVMMMTSWAIVADVWYLPPMQRHADEDAISFANRVKSVIARKGGLVDLEWDGQLKRHPVSQKMIQQQRKLYSQRFSSPDVNNDVKEE